MGSIRKSKKMSQQNTKNGFKGEINEVIRRMYESALKRTVTDEEIRNIPLTDDILYHLGDL